MNDPISSQAGLGSFREYDFPEMNRRFGGLDPRDVTLEAVAEITGVPAPKPTAEQLMALVREYGDARSDMRAAFFHGDDGAEAEANVRLIASHRKIIDAVEALS